MPENQIEQIKNVLKNIESVKKYVPFFSDLEKNEAVGPLFKSLNDSEKQSINNIINNYIKEKINSSKTKGGELFKRFFENQNDAFWEFRKLNDKNIAIDKLAFQRIGKKVEKEIFKYEGILTEPMLKQEKGLEKVVGAFYDIVYGFFPRYNEIE